MRFDYRAVNGRGQLITGNIIADDNRSAIRSLRRQGLEPVQVDEVVERQARMFVKRPRRAEIAMLLNQLVVLLKAGVSVDEAVSSLADTTEHPLIRKELVEINTRLRRGEAMSAAVAETDFDLPPYIHQLIRAGEMTGQLAQSLEDGVRQLEYELATTTEMRNALIYPGILVATGTGAVLLMFTLVVPKFTKLLDKSGGEVPLLGKLVLSTGQFFNDNMLLVGGVLVAAVVGGVFAFSNPLLRARLWDGLVAMPLVGPWLREIDIGRWASMLATLLSSRIELTQSLELAQEGVTSNRLRANLSQVTTAVRGGKGLAEALQDSSAITATGYGLVKVGQESGELAMMLRSLASLYEDSSRNRMKRFLTVLEPVAILLIGGVIGLIMTGIMLAITSVHSISV